MSPRRARAPSLRRSSPIVSNMQSCLKPERLRHISASDRNPRCPEPLPSPLRRAGLLGRLGFSSIGVLGRGAFRCCRALFRLAGHCRSPSSLSPTSLLGSLDLCASSGATFPTPSARATREVEQQATHDRQRAIELRVLPRTKYRADKRRPVTDPERDSGESNKRQRGPARPRAVTTINALAAETTCKAHI